MPAAQDPVAVSLGTAKPFIIPQRLRVTGVLT